MARFDYDVVIIGSGFGGSVAALRAAEKGYRVGVMESGRRWPDEDIPKSQWDLPHFLWFPAAELYGIQRIEYLDDVLVLSRRRRRRRLTRLCQHDVRPAEAVLRRAGMGQHHRLGRRAGAVLRPGDADARRRPLPVHADRRRPGMQAGRERHRAEGRRSTRPRSAVYFGSPGVEADDPYFGGVGPRRTGCISCGNCNNGCGHNAKNKLTTNYLYLAEKLGAEVHELHEVYDLVAARGRRIRGARPPPRLGAARRAPPPSHVHRRAGDRRRPRLRVGEAPASHAAQGPAHRPLERARASARGRTPSSCSTITRTHGEWKRDPDKIHIMPGSVTITSGVWPDPVTSIEPTYWGVGSNVFAFLGTYHQHGEQKHSFESWLKEILRAPERGDRASPTRATGPSGRSSRSARRRPTRRSSSTGTTACCTASRPVRHRRCTSLSIEDFVDRIAKQLGPARRRSPPRSSTATPPPTSSAGSRSARAARPAPSTPTCASSASRASTSWTAA